MHACGCRLTEQNDRQPRRERERESDLSTKKRLFQATSSFIFDRFVLNGPCCRHGFEIDKIQDLFKTFSANRQIQDFFKVWKRLLKDQDLFKTLRPACEPCCFNFCWRFLVWFSYFHVSLQSLPRQVASISTISSPRLAFQKLSASLSLAPSSF